MIKKTPLLAGVRGTYQTVSAMKYLIKKGMQDEKTRRVAKELKAKAKSQIEYYELCHKYVAENIEYRRDEWKGKETEVVASTKHTLDTRKYGDCDDMTVALATLLMLNGIKCRIKIVAWKPEYKDQYTHVYLLAYIEKYRAWIPADPVRDATIGTSGFGWEIAPVYMQESFSI